MTHDRCSELLGSFVRGDLPPEDARAVREHLAGCELCRAEHRAVATLATGDTPAMDDVERARLHRGLAQELFKPRANADVAASKRTTPRWARWVAPAFATAAVLAGIFVMATGGGSDDEAAQLSAEAPAAEDAQERGGLDTASRGDGGGGSSGDESTKESSNALSAQAGPETSFDAAGDPTPAFYGDAGRLSSRDLVGLGDFRTYAAAYSPADSFALYDPFLKEIASAAGDAGREVQECGATLPPDGGLIPVYGAVGEYDDGDVLVLAFVTSDPGSEELDRYLIWVWARGDCDQPIDTFFERIGAR